MKTFTLKPGCLTLDEIKKVLDTPYTLKLDSSCHEKIDASADVVTHIIEEGKVIYGVNTGFGKLANKKIDIDKLQTLQRNLILSHAAGTGNYLPDEVVQLTLLLKINSLARGYSGVRRNVIDALIALYNTQIYPCLPCKGSVGASGDLAPLAHLSAVLLGIGEVHHQGKTLSAREGLEKAGLMPFTFLPKEGLALVNGVQVSTAIAIKALLSTEAIFDAAIIAGSLSTEACIGSDEPFDARIHTVRGHSGQQDCAERYRALLAESGIRAAQKQHDRTQDPYSLRCQPQVMGACLTHIRFVSEILSTEANAVSDNPLVFSNEKEIISGGNFHGEPVAMAADTLALAIAEIGALSERRIALLIDKHLSQLPSFLVEDSGLNSGFMLAQVTAAAVASENKSRAHPASVDSLPTSANQEDHVSMSMFAARRLLDMTDNTETIVAIELLAACQGIDFHKPLKTSPKLHMIYQAIRERVPFYDKDRYMALDISTIKEWLSKEGYAVMKKIDGAS